MSYLNPYFQVCFARGKWDGYLGDANFEKQHFPRFEWFERYFSEVLTLLVVKGEKGLGDLE